MKSYLAFLFISLALFSCKKELQKVCLANIINQPINIESVDSIAKQQLYEVRKQALKIAIKNKVVASEAFKRKIGIEELSLIEVRNKAEKVSITDYQEYIRKYALVTTSNDSLKIIEYLNTIKVKQRHDFYTDSLIENANIKVFLEPPVYKEIDLSNNLSFNLTPENNVVVYLISDYDCPSCNLLATKIASLIKKYESKVNFKIIIFSNYVSNKALATYSAWLLGNFAAMYKQISKRNYEMTKKEIFKVAKEIGLNDSLFQKNFCDPSILKHFLNEKEDLISKGIYATPTIVVNSKVLDDDFAIYTLENAIENELHQDN